MVRCINLTCAVFLAGTALTSTAFAQEPSQPAQATAGLNEIIVTATKKSENLQDVPVSLSVVSPEVLTRQNVVQTTDLPRIAPGVNFSMASVSTATSFVIRGVATFALGDALESSAGVAIDGVPLGRPAGSITQMVDVERVEVLRGPQGLLFGKNTTAGLIHIITAEPRFENSYSGRLYYGEGDDLRIQGTVNINLIDNVLATRITGWSFSHDGFIRARNLSSDLGSLDTKGFRVRTRFSPNDTLDIKHIFEWSKQDDTGLVYTLDKYQGLQFSNALQTVNDAEGIRPDTFASSTDEDHYNRLRVISNTVQIDQQIGGSMLTSVTSLRNTKAGNRSDAENTPNRAPAPRIFPADYIGTQRQFTQELRISTPSSAPISLIAGLFYYNLDLDSRTEQGFTRLFASLAGRINLIDISSKNYAAFGEVTVRPVENVRLIAGGRLSRDEVKGRYRRVTPSYAVIVPGATYEPLDLSGTARYTNFSWRLGAQYDLDRDVMVFATASSGYKGPGLRYTNDVTIAQLAAGPVKAETVTSYEVGIKSELFDRTLRLNGSIYRADYRDFQVVTLLPTTPSSYSISNAGGLRAEGGEIEAEWLPTAGLSLDGNVAYSNAHFTDFPSAPCFVQQTAATGCVGGTQNVNGQPTPNAPRWTWTVGGRYEWALAGSLNVFLGANVSHKGSVYYSIGADADQRAVSYELVNLSAGIRSPDDRYGLTFYVNNLFDQEFVIRKQAAFGVAWQIYPFEAQRRIGAAIDFRF